MTEWESALRDAIELNLPDVQDTRPTRHFLQAVEEIAPLFSQTWFNTIETKAVMTPDVQLNTVIPDGFQIAQIFRNQHLLTSNRAVLLQSLVACKFCLIWPGVSLGVLGRKIGWSPPVQPYDLA